MQFIGISQHVGLWVRIGDPSWQAALSPVLSTSHMKNTPCASATRPAPTSRRRRPGTTRAAEAARRHLRRSEQCRTGRVAKPWRTAEQTYFKYSAPHKCPEHCQTPACTRKHSRGPTGNQSLGHVMGHACNAHGSHRCSIYDEQGGFTSRVNRSTRRETWKP